MDHKGGYIHEGVLQYRKLVCVPDRAW